jgi:KaiC/GvpD/RAD55 family RecA-like ATPase
MNRLRLHEPWLNEVLPQGLPYPSSTLISGPGGSGKPLIGFAFVYDWLTAGGNVIFMPLQYPNMTFGNTSPVCKDF